MTALAVVLIVAILSACTTSSRLDNVPLPLLTKAEVPGLPGVRYWYTLAPEEAVAEARRTVEKQRSLGRHVDADGKPRTFKSLALSGGGDQGAFGAGLLVGWTEAGNRPEFDVVTGISTGALIAPFAFLGSKYDDLLKTAYTTLRPDLVYRKKSLIQAYFSDGATDITPLEGLVAGFATADLMRRVAEEYEKGRLLLIGTTNLDARRRTVWNMGKIAASGHPDSLALFRKVLIASASVPAIVPPVMIEVEADGKRFHEMHVDGGAMAQVFFNIPSVSAQHLIDDRTRKRKSVLYVIRNGQIDPAVGKIDRRTMTIGFKALSAMIASQGVGDLYTIYLLSQRDGVDFNLASIGEDFQEPHPEEFHPPYMQALFDYGYQRARTGYPWEKLPPHFTPK
jgi:hypothetical protein